MLDLIHTVQTFDGGILASVIIACAAAWIVADRS